MWVNGSHGQKYRRVVELCGMDPDAILAEADTKRVQPPTIDSSLQQALDLADDDAFRMRQSDVRPENLLFGLCRAGGSPLLFFVQTSGMDRERFHADVLERVRHAKARIEHPPLAMNAESDAMLHRAREIAVELHRDQASGLHLLSALVSDEHGFAAELLTRYAGNRVKLIEELKRV